MSATHVVKTLSDAKALFTQTWHTGHQYATRSPVSS